MSSRLIRVDYNSNIMQIRKWIWTMSILLLKQTVVNSQINVTGELEVTSAQQDQTTAINRDPNIRTLQLDGRTDNDTAEASTAINRDPNIRTLQLDGRTDNDTAEASTAINRDPNIRTLQQDGRTDNDTAEASTAINRDPNIRTLQLDGRTDNDTAVASTAINRDPNIRTLQLDGRTDNDTAVASTAINRDPNIRTLQQDGRTDNDTAVASTAINRAPNIRTLQLDGHTDSDTPEASTAINRASNIRTLQQDGRTDNDTAEASTAINRASNIRTLQQDRRTDSDTPEESTATGIPVDAKETCQENDTSATEVRDTNTTETHHGFREYFSYVTTPLLLTTGLLGNVLTITVMLSKEFSSMTMSFILIALALSDTTVLLMQPFTKLWVIKMIGMDVRALSDLSCKIFFILFRTSKMSSSWFVVLVCFERFVAVWFPLRARTICRKRNALLSLAGVIATLIVFNGFWSFASKVVDGTYCLVNYIYPSIAMKSRIFTVMGTVTYAGVPTILLITMTPAIIYRILQQTKQRRELSSASLRRRDNNQKTIAMLMSVVIAYIMLATPIGFVFIIALVRGENLYQSKDPTLSVIREVAQALDLLNYSINFFLYVAFSSTFRGRVAQICRCKLKVYTNSRNQSLSGTS